MTEMAPSKEIFVIPRDTRDILDALHGKSVTSICKHAGLLLTRYAPKQAAESGKFFDPQQRRDISWREHWLRQICNVFPLDSQIYTRPNWGFTMRDYLARWKEQIRLYDAASFHLKAQSRLIVGLGNKGPLEIGMTLHHTTGLPYIPGSALKGLCRNYALFTLAAQLGVSVLPPDKPPADSKQPTPLQMLADLLVLPPDPPAAPDEVGPRAKALQQLNQAITSHHPAGSPLALAMIDALPATTHFRQAFGSQASSGACVFFDAMLAGLPPVVQHGREQRKTLFEVDVMAPHFSKYYSNQGQTAPTDNLPVIPIPFLTVAAGTSFAFAVGMRRSTSLTQAARIHVMTAALDWLKQALCEFGIGAKTAAGYGAFGE